MSYCTRTNGDRHDQSVWAKPVRAHARTECTPHFHTRVQQIIMDVSTGVRVSLTKGTGEQGCQTTDDHDHDHGRGRGTTETTTKRPKTDRPDRHDQNDQNHDRDDHHDQKCPTNSFSPTTRSWAYQF